MLAYYFKTIYESTKIGVISYCCRFTTEARCEILYTQLKSQHDLLTSTKMYRYKNERYHLVFLAGTRRKLIDSVITLSMIKI